MEKHTEYGASILRDNNGIPPEAIDIAHHHHERVDRSGYPNKPGGPEIIKNAKIVGIDDVYDSRPAQLLIAATSAIPMRSRACVTGAACCLMQSSWRNSFSVWVFIRSAAHWN